MCERMNVPVPRAASSPSGIDQPRLADEHPAPAADPAPLGDRPARLFSGRVKTRLKAVVSRKRSLTIELQA